MKSKAFLITIIVVLVLLNIATLSFMWYQRIGNPRPGKVVDPVLFLAKRLDFNQHQRHAFRELRIRFKAEMEPLEMEDRRLHHRFFDLVLRSPYDSMEVQRLADSIVILRREIELRTHRHFVEIHDLLDERQRERFDTVFHEALRAALPPPPPPPPPPGGRRK